jgi:glucose-1-phosphate cytidylyltransferase
MKVVLLAGGMGTRILEESEARPKPMVEIGGKPILWHIMKIYSWYGFNDFIICCGYKGYMIKEYFANYFLHMADVTIDMLSNKMEVHQKNVEPWKVTLIDTGLNTMTGGRIKRIQPYVGKEAFMLTYGDGVSDINIKTLLAFHASHGKMLTLTAVQPSGKFGALDIDASGRVRSFQEKPKDDGAFINAGFFVLEPDVFEYIQAGDATIWERDPLEGIARDGQLMAFKHEGFWKPMDTLKDKLDLEAMWAKDAAQWKVWP